MDEVISSAVPIQILSQTSGAAKARRRVAKGLPRYSDTQAAYENARDKRRGTARLNEKLEWLIDYKLTHGCVDCGYSEHPAALDFDHLPGSVKKDTVARLTGQTGATLVVLQAEVAKCELVCSNCHRIRHFNRRREVAS